MLKIIQKRWFYHGVPWLLVSIQPFADVLKHEPWRSIPEAFLMTMSLVGPLVLAVYGHFYIISRFLEKRQYWHYLLWLPVLIVFYISANILLLKLWGHTNRNAVQEFINIVLVFSVTAGLRYFKRGIQNRLRMQEIEAQNARSELQMLKNQINPHFLFNTLNNIYATNQTDPAKGSEMILELAEVLVYHMGHIKKEALPLEEEIQLIESYITLEKLRLNPNCDLQIDLNPQHPQLKIAPLILMPFIENAFKHGTHPVKPCFVHIRITTTDKQYILFEVSNSIMHNKHIVKSHIGLENTTRRLQLIYPDTHKLVISEHEGVHRVHLTLHA